MNLYLITLIFVILFILVNYLLKKYNFLLDNLSYSDHKKFISLKSIPLSGGLLCLVLVLFFFKDFGFFEKILISCIYILGILSDVNKINSPLIRIFAQAVIVGIIIISSQLFIPDIRIDFIDNILLTNYQFKFAFTLFCLLVLINGSNFMDGVNTLLSGYFILVIVSIIYVFGIKNNILIISDIYQLLVFLIIFVFFNISSKSLLGDSGSYLLSLLIGFFSIELYSKYNDVISPYYICLILWYPAFENLFSIIRRQFFEKKKIKKADNLHFHHLLFKFLNKKIKTKETANNFTGVLINSILLVVFFLAALAPNHTIYILCLILFESILYLSLYLYLRYKID